MHSIPTSNTEGCGVNFHQDATVVTSMGAAVDYMKSIYPDLCTPTARVGACAWGGSCTAPLGDQTPAGIEMHLKHYHIRSGTTGRTPSLVNGHTDRIAAIT
ncbi:hypothetical protein A0H81_12095 [Grifola frondosa]|uniref:Uncharacterized protein n=1 Tax=Grifola frondosa TaxID=5627 RepID=A0A1C7LSF7_GRIFR|nr:hypothetical protein A0H81_12095 [Grifola frondosa]